MKSKTWIEVSKTSLLSNIASLRNIVGRDITFLAVVKANAYGIGIETVVSATNSVVDWYGVDSLAEAERVRTICQNPVLILGYVDKMDVIDVVKAKFSVTVYDYELAVALSKTATEENPARIHIKVDTGLIRLGRFPEETIELAQKISKLPNIVIEGLYTHYARLVDERGVSVYSEQLEKFNLTVDILSREGIKPPLLHTASSMASVLYKETRFNMVRMGIPMYGFWSRESSETLLREKQVELNLCQVITWKTTVVNVKKVSAKTGIGYGHSEIVARETTVAVLGAGFYDGIDKRYGKIGNVLIRGKRAKVLGGIAMNMCMVDVTDIPNVTIGDVAILIGRSDQEEIAAYEFAKTINTSTYEVIARINPLLTRILVEDGV